MRILLALVSLAPALAAPSEEVALSGPVRSTWTSGELAAHIQLAPRGCWEGLLLNVTTRPPVPPVAEATVEVWDVAYQETRFQETFRLFRDHLLLSIRQNWRFAPTSHGRIEAGLRAGDGTGADTNRAMTQSLQQRFNPLPPSGSSLR